MTAHALTAAAVFFSLAFAAPGASADVVSIDGVWTAVNQVPAEHLAGGAWVRPDVAQPVMLNVGALKNILAHAPLEDTPEADNAPVILRLPTPEGRFARFRVVESPIMEKGLAEKFPEMKTYLGQGIDDPAATLRADWTEQGFHAQVLTPEGSFWIDPYTRGNLIVYSSYHKDGLRDVHGFHCFTEGHFVLPEAVRNAANVAFASGGTRRQYRLANACTGEYAAAVGGGTVSGAQAAIVTAINRVTGVYELECAIRLVLVANNTNVVYTNSATDPYTNNNGGTMLGQNVTACNAQIGSANYDIGHVFSTGGGGVAGLGVVCGGSKAWGVTGSSSPTGDAFWIDYVAHEMGHQFGGNHNFNGTGGSCSGNRNAATAYEPGSGNSIMAYAGICSPDDLQAHSDAYFQHVSYDEIMAFVASGGTCSSNTATGNSPPTVNAGPDYTIPFNTPFELTAASASDPDGDAISYLWDERDKGAAQATPFTDNGTSPFIRGWPAVTTASRLVPRLSNLKANTFAVGEHLPQTSRTVNFRCTVRDNRAGNGGVNFDDMKITTTTAAGPFVVSSPNTGVSWSGTQTVTWNVTNTTAAPVSCANVKILLSTDGGNTWPTTLIASTPNDGSEAVTLPSVSTSTARIKVAAVGNIFFDISNVNFTITPGVPATPSNVAATPSTICPSQSTALTATVGAGETVYWYTGGCGTTLAGTGSPLNVSPSATTTYYARARRNSDSVFSTNCASVLVTVDPLPTAPSDAAADRATILCSDGGTITLTATGGTGTTVRWFKDSCGGVQVGTTNPLTIPAPTSSTTYYVRYETSCGNSACASAAVFVISSDFNEDTFVSGEDFDAFAEAFVNGDPSADVNGDGFVSGEDFDAYTEAFFWGC